MSSEALEVLKSALLLEHKGKALYTRAAQQTESAAARELFEFLAREEKEHIDYLTRQFRHQNTTGHFVGTEKAPKQHPPLATDILTKRIAKEISAAGYEAAIIMAAINLEEQAIRTYADRATATQDEAERGVYQELGAFEHEHLDMLLKMNKEITHEVWFDNKFWPY